MTPDERFPGFRSVERAQISLPMQFDRAEMLLRLFGGFALLFDQPAQDAVGLRAAVGRPQGVGDAGSAVSADLSDQLGHEGVKERRVLVRLELYRDSHRKQRALAAERAGHGHDAIMIDA